MPAGSEEGGGGKYGRDSIPAPIVGRVSATTVPCCWSRIGVPLPVPGGIVAVSRFTSILQVRRPDSVQVANYLMERMGKGSATAELVHPDELVAGVISQVAAEPDIGELLASFVYNNDGRP